MYDYFYGAQSDQFSFIRIPTVLFSEERFKALSAEAKVLYGILLKRMDLSARSARAWAGRISSMSRILSPVRITIQESSKQRFRNRQNNEQVIQILVILI